MLDGRRIAVVVPAFDEARWIEGTLRTMPAYVDAIVVIDDASTDRTGELARSVGDPRVFVLRNPERAGVGAAIVRGYRWAAARADVVAVMAGDGQMHPDDLVAVLAPILRGAADYVKGDRLAHPSVRVSMPLGRRVGTATFAALTRLAAGLDALSDSQCGFTAASTHALRALDLEALWPGYGYPNDLLGALALGGLRVAEVPVRPVYRGEASGIRAWHLPLIGFIIARIAVRRLTSARRTPEARPCDPGLPTSPRTLPAPAPASRPVALAAPP